MLLVITLADIFEALIGARPTKPGLSFKEVTFHSKQVHANSLFVAVPGDHKDGHTYVGDAFHRGARAAIVQRDMKNLYPVVDLRGGTLPDHLIIPKIPFCLWVDDTQAALEKLARYWCARINPTVIAIAGCTPDSVVNDLVAAIVALRWPEIHHYDDPKDILQVCFDLLHLDSSEECLILEIQPDELPQMKAILDLTQPQVGLVIHPPCLPRPADPCPADTAGSVLYDLFSYLPRAPRGNAVLNYDHAEERQIASQIHTRPIFYGLNPLADLWADEIEGQGQEGIRFHIHYRFESIVLRTPILGRHSVHIALQAAAVGLALGLTWQEIATGLRMDGYGLRLVTARTPSGAILVDDTYSNSAESALSALNLINQFEGRKIAVLAEIPNSDPADTVVEMVGTRAAEVCDVILAVGEKARPVIEGARRSRRHDHFLIWAPNPQEAIKQLADRIHPEDIILIKGSQEVRMDSIVTALEGNPV
jgi:UDP-N-acetylmuramoyl-tripeptide--D-alanyl-D-alanine ligase